MLPEASRRLRLEMAPPPGERCAVCRGDISVPHQANCSHWFCGHCIIGVWLHRSVFWPCDCPVCRRPITLLVPSEAASLLRDEPEIVPVLDRIEQYNGRFAGVPHNMIQVLLAVLYLMFPVDIVPEVLGYLGLVDDLLILIIMYAYISAVYKAILVARHAA